MPLVALVLLTALLAPLPLRVDRRPPLLLRQLHRPRVAPGVRVAMALPLAVLLAAVVLLLALDLRQPLLAALQNA